MHFVYAFFFESGDDMHIKVGQSTTPYKRLQAITNGSPFPVTMAVYCHCGSKGLARSFERMVAYELRGLRTRGEWYVLPKTEGKIFRDVAMICFAKATGRSLKWQKIDLDAYRADQVAASTKWQGRYMKKTA